MHHARHVHAVAHRSVELLTAGLPEEAEEAAMLAALALRLRRGEWGARGAGAPPGGHGASIFLGGSDPFQPEIFFCVFFCVFLPTTRFASTDTNRSGPTMGQKLSYP
jgi:hypothetical protein